MGMKLYIPNFVRKNRENETIYSTTNRDAYDNHSIQSTNHKRESN